MNEDEKNVIRNQVLEKSNYYRKKYHIPEFKLDKDINSYAQEWADIIGNTNKFDYRGGNKYGENIYMGGLLSKNLGEEAVDVWYSEIEDYHECETEEELWDNYLKIGHMAQLLWKASKNIGVGVSKGAEAYYVVANFDPSGNNYGQYLKNLPKIKDTPCSGQIKEHYSIGGLIIFLIFII